MEGKQIIIDGWEFKVQYNGTYCVVEYTDDDARLFGKRAVGFVGFAGYTPDGKVRYGWSLEGTNGGLMLRKGHGAASFQEAAEELCRAVIKTKPPRYQRDRAMAAAQADLHAWCAALPNYSENEKK